MSISRRCRHGSSRIISPSISAAARRWSRPGWIALAMLVLVATPRAAAARQAPVCRVDTLTAGFPKAWLGQSVGQLSIDAQTVETPGGIIGNVVRELHTRTQLWVPMNEISLTLGSPIDSLELLESVRRVRATGLYTEVTVTGARCGNDPLELTVHTRDAWSLRTNVRYGRTSSRVALTEVNLFGRALTVSASAEKLETRSSATFGLAEPYLFGTHVRGAAYLRVFADGRAWSWSLRSPQYSPRDLWRYSVSSFQLRRYQDDGLNLTLTDISRRADAGTAAVRWALDEHRAYAFVFGAEHEQAKIIVRQPGARLGSPEVSREFSAAIVGVARRSLDVGKVNWLVPGQPNAELPLGVEGEWVVGIGPEATTKKGIAHFDGWSGVTLLPTPTMIVTGDVWASGYGNQDSLSNGTIRAAGSIYQHGRGGIWALRVSFERLQNPDPDVYALSMVDPVLRSLAPTTRLAESALTASLERSFTMYSREGRWAADAVPFIQFSERHRSVDVSNASPTNPQALLVGLGFRHLFNQPTQATVRFDIAKTVWSAGGLSNRWVFVLSTQPWLANGRVRDGLREAVR